MSRNPSVTNRFTGPLLILLASVAVVSGQTNKVFLEKRGNDWWAVWTNTPVLFRVYTSTNMTDWQLWLTKHSGPPLISFETMLVHSNDFRFLKFEPIDYPVASTNMAQALKALTNALQIEQNKRKKPQ